MGVPKTASDDDIKKAYRKKVVAYHPDKFAGASEKEKKDAEAMCKEINHAYEVLSNKRKTAPITINSAAKKVRRDLAERAAKARASADSRIYFPLSSEEVSEERKIRTRPVKARISTSKSTLLLKKRTTEQARF